MKRILSFTICALMPLFMYSQNVELNSLTGEWRWIDNTTSEEFHIFLRPGIFEIPAIFGGGTENCLVGVYKYSRGGTVVADYYSELSESKGSILYPIRVLNTLSLSVRDYSLKNANGRNKILSGNSRIEYISDKQLKWILIDNAHESISTSANSTYPEGTSLPTNIILTKVE